MSTDRHTSSTQDKQHVTTWLLVLLILELTGMTCYTLIDIRSQLSPANLVDRAEQAIRENYPQVRERIKEEIEAESDQIAQQISHELVESSPEIRQWLERATARQLELALDEATELSAEEFRGFLQDNRQQVLQAFGQLERAPEQGRELASDLETRMDEWLGVDLRSQSRKALQLHRQLNTKLERLGSDAPLDPKELLERRIVRILRTLQEERLPDLPEVNGLGAGP